MEYCTKLIKFPTIVQTSVKAEKPLTCLFSAARFSLNSSTLTFKALVVTLMLGRYFLSTKGSSHIVLPKLQDQSENNKSLGERFPFSLIQAPFFFLRPVTLLPGSIHVIKSPNLIIWRQLVDTSWLYSVKGDGSKCEHQNFFLWGWGGGGKRTSINFTLFSILVCL